MNKKQNGEFRTKFFTELFDNTKAMLMKLGIDELKAAQAAREFTRTMRVQWSGGQLYIGTIDYIALNERDHKIYDEFNGTNHNALAIKHKVSVQWIYKILDVMRAQDVAQRQSNLDLQEESSNAS